LLLLLLLLAGRFAVMANRRGLMETDRRQTTATAGLLLLDGQRLPIPRRLFVIQQFLLMLLAHLFLSLYTILR
jgi:hypothetical protein